MKKSLLLSAALSLFISNYAFSSQDGAPSEKDIRVRYFDYHPEDVYQLAGYFGFVTTIFFRDDEKVESISLGDPKAWDVQTSGSQNYVFVKPILQPAKRTNLTIITTRRIYAFELMASEVKDDIIPSNLSLKVRFNYSEPPIAQLTEPDPEWEKLRAQQDADAKAEQKAREAEERADRKAREAEEKARQAQEKAAREAEAKKLADEARKKAEAEKAALAARLAAPSLIYDALNDKKKGKDDPKSGSDGQPRDFSQDYKKMMDESRSDDQAFLDDQAARGAPPAQEAQVISFLDSKIIQGSMISGILETAIDSTLTGMIRASVADDVFSADGSRVLIPKGSRLIGSYRSAVQFGTSRVLISWNRVVTPDGVSVELGSSGTDSLGRAGLTGDVDTHFAERFGAAALLSVIEGGTAYGVQTLVPEASQDTAGNTSKAFGANVGRLLDPYVNIPTTISVDQGARVLVYVARDLDFKAALAASSSVAGVSQ